MSPGIVTWWCFLCAVGMINITAWSLSAAALRRRQGVMSRESYAGCRLQLLLSAVYVFGCAFRSVLPVYDVPRLCLFNIWLSSVVVGRSVATFAELCFVGQWALMMRETARVTSNVFAWGVARTIVPLIAVAELCSWYSVLTTSNLGHVFEDSIWGLGAAILVAGMTAIWPRCPPRRRRVLLAWCIAGVGYVAFMFLIDVPMYWSRWARDEAHGRHYLTLAQGLFDVTERRVVSYRWVDWKSEITWMSLYFSVAVWVSISLILASAREARRAADSRQRPVEIPAE
jgi:hypothetical protein